MQINQTDQDEISNAILGALTEQPWICIVSILAMTDSMDQNGTHDTLSAINMVSKLRQMGWLQTRNVPTRELKDSYVTIYAVKDEQRKAPRSMSVTNLFGRKAA